MTAREANDYIFLSAVFSVFILASLFFCATTYFYREQSPKRKADIEEMWTNMHTPVIQAELEGRNTDTRQTRTIGWLSLA